MVCCDSWLWGVFGRVQADLIHLGAKYSPCMRHDEHVMNAILDDRQKEKETGCCVRNDGSGCVQTQQADCSVCSTLHWLQASCSCAQGVTRPTSTVPCWRLSALDRHRPPIAAIGWCLDVCHNKNTNASRRQEFFRHWTVSLELSVCHITWQRYLTCTV